MKRLPQGYVGINHETRGGDIQAILKVLHTPEITLGPELYRKISKVQADAWYPIGDLLELFERLDSKLGAYGLRQVGWTIFSTFHAAQARAHFSTAHALLHAFDGLYHQGNRGTKIGGWRVAKFQPGLAVLEKFTPHHCGMEYGILEEALRTIGVRAEVTHPECFRQGAPLCQFQVSARAVDNHWQ